MDKRQQLFLHELQPVFLRALHQPQPLKLARPRPADTAQGPPRRAGVVPLPV